MTSSITSSSSSSSHFFLTHPSDSIELNIAQLKEVKELSEQKNSFNALILLINQSSSVSSDTILTLIKTLVDIRFQGCTDGKEAILLIFPRIENSSLLRDAGKRYFLPDDCSITHEQAQDALWFASYTGDISIGSQALSFGADVNELISCGTTPLLLACKRAHGDYVDFLLDCGADVKFCSFSTPLSEALLHPEKMGSRIKRLQMLESGFTEEVLDRKFLAHQFSVVSNEGKSLIEGFSFDLSGFYVSQTLSEGELFYDKIYEEIREGKGPLFEEILLNLPDSAKAALRENPAIREQVCQAIESTRASFLHFLKLETSGIRENPRIMAKEMINCLKLGLPALCFGATRTKSKWENGTPKLHAWGYVITKNPKGEDYYVQRCNRGLGAGERCGIVATYLEKDQVITLIEDYYEAVNHEVDFSDNGNDFLEKSEREIQEGSCNFIRQKEQRIGNCSYYSLRSLRRAMITALISPILEDSKVAEQLGKSIDRVNAQSERKARVERYLERHFSSKSPYFPEVELLRAIFEKVKSKPPFSKLFPPYITRIESTTNPVCNRVKFSRPVGEEITPEKFDSIEKICNFVFSQRSSISLSNYLVALQLSSLNLTTLPGEISKMVKLERLTLEHNALTAIALSAMPCLVAICAGNNQIETVDIESMPNLTRLELQRNKIREVNLHNLPKLSALDLSNNQLKTLQNLELPDLRQLDVASNQLKKIPSIVHLPLLFRLNLNYNLIKIFPLSDSSQLKRVEQFQLFDNPLFLNCIEPTPEFTAETLKFLPKGIPFFKEQQLYAVPEFLNDTLASLYHHLISSAHEEDPAYFAQEVDSSTQTLFARLSEDDREIIEWCIQELHEKGSEETNAYGKEHCFDQRIYFYGAVHNAILLKVRLIQINRFQLKAYILAVEKANFPESDPAKDLYWFKKGEPTVNLLRLAIAEGLHEKAKSESSSSAPSNS